MIPHLFKMILNRKKKNFFLLLQLFIAFMALFLFTGLNLKKFSSYFKPLGYDDENTWLVEVSYPETNEAKKAEYSQLIKQKLQSISEIEAVTASNTVPFHRWGKEEKIKYSKQVIKALAFETDETYASVLGIKLIAGRWFAASDYALNKKPIVITQDLAERDFSNENPLGKIILIGDKTAVIIGVSEVFKENTL